jgi:hypothetical protein
MGKVKELIGKRWSRWYVILAATVMCIVWVALILCHMGIFEKNWETINSKVIEQLNFLEMGQHLDAHGNEKLAEARSLMGLQQFLTDWQVILGAGLLVGYFGFSLDASYKWLRKRRTAKAPES